MPSQTPVLCENHDRDFIGIDENTMAFDSPDNSFESDEGLVVQPDIK